MFKEKIKTLFTKFSYQAVCYAEEQIGGGNGKLKKEIAIDFLISKLPIYLNPFSVILRSVFDKIADELIERAVDKLHSVQKQVKEKMEQNNG